MTDAVDIIKKFEGFRNKAYLCPANKWTIGYGFTFNPLTNTPVDKGQFISEDIALVWLDKFCDDIKEELYELLPTLSPNQREALTSFIFNIGMTRFKRSTMFKMLKQNEIIEASKQFQKWIYVGKTKLNGLVKRRLEEKNLFMLTTSANF